MFPILNEQRLCTLFSSPEFGGGRDGVKSLARIALLHRSTSCAFKIR
jgi:hypothetical protein